MQALELTNGTTLDNTLKAAATKWLQDEPNPIAMANEIYQTTLGRLPNHAEREIAQDLLGDKPTPESTADLLWIIVMLPEFNHPLNSH